MIDWHCHILPGIDDGPATMAEAVAMAAALRDAGFTTVYCTPHMIRGGFDADNPTVVKTIAELQIRLEKHKIDLALLPGREYYLDESLSDYLNDPLPLGDSGYLLIEIPDHASADLVMRTLNRVIHAGFVPMVAHPERCRLLELPTPPRRSLRELFSVQCSRFKVFPSTSNVKHRTLNGQANRHLTYLLDLGCAFQGNLGSFAGLYGEMVKRNAGLLRAAGVYTHFGSDLHSIRHKDILSVNC